jgi:hypothetical protein
MNFFERFWNRIDVRGPDECWPWKGYCPRYGQINTTNSFGKRVVLRANRVMLEISTGIKIPFGYEALHTCDNPPCCNPAHLFLGTQADNMLDMKKKRRAIGKHLNSVCGEDSHLSKLTNEEVFKIKLLKGSISSVKLASRIGRSSSLIRQIWRGEIWKHLAMGEKTNELCGN